jgi:hypothetical protein
VGKSKKATLPKEWRKFADKYGADRSYWYVPKGLAVTPQALKLRLKVLKEFEGDAKPWRDLQQHYIKRLNEEGISRADAEWPEGGAPLARMLKKVFGSVGLAWVDPNEHIEITPAGNEFLSSKKPEQTLSKQLSRYQFWNPSVKSKVHRAVKLHPIPFLGEVLRSVDGHGISPVEYSLFIARAKEFDEVDDALERITAFRELDDELQEKIVEACEAYMLGGRRRKSIYNTIKLNRSYALKVWALSDMIESREDHGLILRKGALKQYRHYLTEFNRDGTYIDFANEKDWIAYFGDPNAFPSIDTALEYYISKGLVAEAVAVKEKTTKSKRELRAFQDMVVSEKSVEDYLESHLAVVGDKIGANLKLVDKGRQFSTPVGPIDLLTIDSKTGDYVVIELKKGRSADRVYGQCSRYMGWVRKNLAHPIGVKTHGVIVARSIDSKLKAARDAHDTKVHLIEFDMKFAAVVV